MAAALSVIIVFLCCMNGSSFDFILCDDREVPPNARIIKSPWFQKCKWLCDDGFTIVHSLNKCCLPKPQHSIWTENCRFRCKNGYIMREKYCCPKLPRGATWNSYGTCLWHCPTGYEYDGHACVDDIIAEVLNDYDKKRKEVYVDEMIERLVTDWLDPYDQNLIFEQEQIRSEDYVENLLNKLLEQDNVTDINEMMMNHTLMEEHIDNIIEKELNRSLSEVADEADNTIQNLEYYLKDQDIEDIKYNNNVAEDLEAEAIIRVNGLEDEVEFLRATIRFQNERLKRRKMLIDESAQVIYTNEKLERELEDAKLQASRLRNRTEAALDKLQKAQAELARRRNRILSVSNEMVEVQHSYTNEWIRIDNALLDTGNANVCTISKLTIKQLGLMKNVQNTWQYKTIIGVTNQVEHWPLISIKLRIKGRIFSIQAAVGGTTSLLVSHTDVISKLMNEDGYVIGGA